MTSSNSNDLSKLSSVINLIVNKIVYNTSTIGELVENISIFGNERSARQVSEIFNERHHIMMEHQFLTIPVPKLKHRKCWNDLQYKTKEMQFE